MNWKKYVLVKLLVFLVVYCSAQVNPDNFAEMTDFMPPPPNASSIIKSGVVSVNKNTGAPSISIPLFTLKGRKLSTSISINYASTGIKVDDISGRVGMGWALFSGGVITRTQRGNPDESNTRIDIEPGFAENCRIYDFLKKADGSYYSGWYDSQGDLFNFNMNGISGSFVFDGSSPKVPVLLTPEKYVILYDFSPSAPWNFRITTTDGISYYFGGSAATEKSKRLSGCGKSFAQYWPSAWYLTKIEDSYGETINFTYRSHTYKYDTGLTESATASVCAPSASAMTCVNRSSTEGKLLSMITNDYSSIKFNYAARQDTDDSLVSEIIVSQKTVPLTGNKKFSFTYQNQAASTSYQSVYSIGHSYTPYLISVSEKSFDETISLTHTFTYYDPAGRPPRLSFAQDYWGYFNGQNNGTLLPQPTDPTVAAMFVGSNSNRNPDESSMLKGMLKTVTYPTGGKEEVEYEENRIYNGLTSQHENVSGLRVKKIKTQNYDETPVVKKFYYGDVSNLNQSSLEFSEKPVFLTSYRTTTLGSNFCGHYALYANSLNSIALFENATTSYRYVVEGNGENFEGGAQQTKFNVAPDAAATLVHGNTLIGAPMTNTSTAMNGKIAEEIVYKKELSGPFIALKKKINNYVYDNRITTIVKNYIVNRTYADEGDYGCPTPETPNTNVNEFDVMRYDYVSYWTYLKSFSETLYDQDGANPQTSLTEYFYEQPGHMLPTKIETINSKNELVTEEIKYPWEYANTEFACETLLMRNRISPIVSYKKLVGANTLVEKKSDYSITPASHVVLSAVKNKFTTAINFDIEGTFDSYDDWGNITQFTDRSGMISSIVWGYGNQYPIAKITNATYAQVVATLTVPVTGLQSMSENDLVTELHRIRTGLPAATVTTYTYKYLCGPSSITDPNNNVSYYEYDAFNRLTLIRDNDYKILKKYCYKYNGQQEDCTTACTNSNAVWQNTTALLRCKISACAYTGYQEQEQQDINPCSGSYGQKRWISAGYNPSGCTSPPLVTLTSINNTSTTLMVAEYTNTVTGAIYTFNINPSSTTTLGCVPSGIYNIRVYRPIGSIFLAFTIGSNTITGAEATFYNIDLKGQKFRTILLDGVF